MTKVTSAQSRLRTNLFVIGYPGYGVWLLLLLLAQAVSAQKRWTFAECLAFAQTNNNQIRQAGLTQDKRAVQLRAAKNLLFPVVDARVRTAGNWGFIIDPSTNVLSDRFNLGNQAGLNASLDLFNGFATANQTKLRNQELIMATYGYQMGVNSVSIDVVYSFLQVLLAQEQVKNSQQRSVYLTKQQQKVKAQVDKGVLNRRTLLNLRSLVAAEDLLGVYATNNVEKAQFNLMQVMGLDLAGTILIDPVPIPDQWPTAIMDPDAVVAASATALPDLKAAQAGVEAAQYTWQLQRADYMPSLALTAQLATRTSNYKAERFSAQLRDNLNRQVGVSLYVPIFSRFMARTTDQLAKLDILSAKLTYQQADRELRRKVMSALIDYTSAAKKYGALQVQYEAVSEEYRYAEKMFELGGIDAIQYGLTRSQLIAAQSDLLQAKYDCFFKQKIVDFYQGKPLLF